MYKKIYFIGIGGIGVSALARYYQSIGYEVYGSDASDSSLVQKLISEGIDITLGTRAEFLDTDFEKVVFSEAIKVSHSERKQAAKLGIPEQSYPQALGEIANKHSLIAIAGTHGKSTTTSLSALMLHKSSKDFTAIFGTLLSEFGGKNFFYRNKNSETEYFLLEACEYKRSFLNYKPFILAITNIELDHLDYYSDEEDYVSAYIDAVKNIVPGGYAILNKEEKNAQKLADIRDDINYVWIDGQTFFLDGEMYNFPTIELQIAGEHILFDAKIAYIIGTILKIPENTILESLASYNGAWRRMEQVGVSAQNNIIISDYGHHPTEIIKTLASIKTMFPEKHILTIFQPHQYSRTIELLNGFIQSFSDTDTLVIPDIYESRDSEADKQRISAEKLVKLIEHDKKYFGNGLTHTPDLVREIEKKYKKGELVIVLMGAGDVDSLRDVLCA